MQTCLAVYRPNLPKLDSNHNLPNPKREAKKNTKLNQKPPPQSKPKPLPLNQTCQDQQQTQSQSKENPQVKPKSSTANSFPA